MLLLRKRMTARRVAAIVQAFQFRQHLAVRGDFLLESRRQDAPCQQIFILLDVMRELGLRHEPESLQLGGVGHGARWARIAPAGAAQ